MLQSFTAAAREDKEEWVSMTARTLGDLQLPLDFHSMLSESAIVSCLGKQPLFQKLGKRSQQDPPMTKSFVSTLQTVQTVTCTS